MKYDDAIFEGSKIFGYQLQLSELPALGPVISKPAYDRI